MSSKGLCIKGLVPSLVLLGDGCTFEMEPSASSRSLRPGLEVDCGILLFLSFALLVGR
jgi:hypothetical protein